MRRTLWGVVVLGCLLGGVAYAQTLLADKKGTLQTCAATCTTGSQANGQAGSTAYNYIDADGLAGVAFQFLTTGTATIEVSNSVDNGTTWILVAGTSSATTPTRSATITTPVGWYRTNVTICTACTFTTTYRTVTSGMRGM